MARSSSSFLPNYYKLWELHKYGIIGTQPILFAVIQENYFIQISDMWYRHVPTVIVVPICYHTINSIKRAPKRTIHHKVHLYECEGAPCTNSAIHPIIYH